MRRLLLLLLLALLIPSAWSQNAPVDFEPNGIGQLWNWKVFENGSNPPVEFVPNPDPDPNGYNPSPTVAKFTALSQGAPFAGCETQHGADIGTFTIDNSNKIIRVMVYKNTISDVGIKLVRFDNGSLWLDLRPARIFPRFSRPKPDRDHLLRQHLQRAVHACSSGSR